MLEIRHERHPQTAWHDAARRGATGQKYRNEWGRFWADSTEDAIRGFITAQRDKFILGRGIRMGKKVRRCGAKLKTDGPPFHLMNWRNDESGADATAAPHAVAVRVTLFYENFIQILGRVVPLSAI